jgi:hypothetical protein
MEIDCDEEDNLSTLAKGITYPNCYTPENVNDFKVRLGTPLCDECKDAFEKIHGSKIKENTSHLQEDFFIASIDEYKKNILNNALSALKTRPLFNTGAKFGTATKECRMKTKEDFLSGCNSTKAKEFLNKTTFFDDLTKEISNDVAKFLTRDFSFNPARTLLNRRKQLCHIPEKDILLYSTSTFEEALSPEMIEFIKKVDPAKFKTVSELFSSDEFIENFGDVSELSISLEGHPLIANHLASTEKFVALMKKVPAPSSTENLRSHLYSSENGDSFDKSLAESCKKSFEVLQKSICSPSFESGKIFNDAPKNFEKLSISKTLPIKDQLASSESLIDSNIKLLEMCQNVDPNGKLNLSTVSKEIAVSLTDEQKSQTLDLFRTNKYNSEVGSLTNALCEMTDKTCIEGTLTCSIYKKYKKFGTTELANSSPADFANNETSQLLRAMIGDTSKIDVETKRILIAEGILPKEDGKFVEQPEMKETQQEFFSKLPAQKINPWPGQTKTSTNLASSQSAIPQSSTSNFSNNSASTTNSSVSAGNMDDISDLVRGSTEDIKNIQDEIKRRLGNLPSTKPATIEDAKKIARDSFKNKGRKITPYQEQALADRMLQPQAPNSSAPTFGSNVNSNSPSVSNTNTQAEKWRNGQKDKALMGMQGAQQVLATDASIGRSPASTEATPKEMTKVALNIAEDPKVKLSDLFSNKIDQNDPETQLLKVLLKNQNNFLLQIKGMNFKVVFNQNNHFNVLLESGDRAEADRMRPQLEIFLKRLKSQLPNLVRTW